MNRWRWIALVFVFSGLGFLGGCWRSSLTDTGTDAPDSSVDTLNDTSAGTNSEPDSESDSPADSNSDSSLEPDAGCAAASESIACDKGVYDGNVDIKKDSDLERLKGYTEISGGLHIGCENCTNLCRLICLETIGAQLWIGHFSSLGDGANLLLKNLNGLNNLTTAGGLALRDNPELEHVDALAGLTTLGELTVIKNTQLESLEGLHKVESIAGSALIRDNLGLKDLKGLDSLKEIAGTFSLYGNHAMLDLTGVENLTKVSGVLEIGFCGQGEDMPSYTNDSLKSLAGLGSLSSSWSLNIGPHPELPYCEVCGLLEHLGLGSPDSEEVCEGNREDKCWDGLALQCP